MTLVVFPVSYWDSLDFHSWIFCIRHWLLDVRFSEITKQQGKSLFSHFKPTAFRTAAQVIILLASRGGHRATGRSSAFLVAGWLTDYSFLPETNCSLSRSSEILCIKYYRGWHLSTNTVSFSVVLFSCLCTQGIIRTTHSNNVSSAELCLTWSSTHRDFL